MESQQPKQVEWYNQWNDRWENYEQITEFLFYDWIHPRTLEDFRAKRVLDVGCGAGRHAQIIAPVAQSVLGVDLNASRVAQAKLHHLPNVTIMQGDMATFQIPDLFELIYCIGVIHHTQNPEAIFKNLSQLCMPGGLLIIWCYSKEGNVLIEYGIEPLRRLVLRHLP
jgi:2-polyprenyl-3-methyl-5-hydroxy-6-metoxy-1,4-benzoquinol methylase